MRVRCFVRSVDEFYFQRPEERHSGVWVVTASSGKLGEGSITLGKKSAEGTGRVLHDGEEYVTDNDSVMAPPDDENDTDRED